VYFVKDAELNRTGAASLIENSRANALSAVDVKENVAAAADRKATEPSPGGTAENQTWPN
jgi:hypothetical protein